MLRATVAGYGPAGIWPQFNSSSGPQSLFLIFADPNLKSERFPAQDRVTKSGYDMSLQVLEFCANPITLARSK